MEVQKAERGARREGRREIEMCDRVRRGDDAGLSVRERDGSARMVRKRLGGADKDRRREDLAATTCCPIIPIAVMTKEVHLR